MPDPSGAVATGPVLAALSAAASWALASIAISRLLSHGRVSPAAANLFKNGLAAASFFVATLVLGGRWPVGEAWGWLFLSGFLGFSVADTLYFAAMTRCGVQTAATVVLLNVPIATLLAVPIVGDRLDRGALVFIGVVLAGVLLVVLDPAARGPRQENGRSGSFSVGVMLALLAALAMGAAVPLGNGRFDDVGVCPGGFIRLAGGALGAFPMAMLLGLGRRSTPGAEVSRLIQPLFAAPGPGSVWGAAALTGVGCAICGLVPYHYALRELPSGIAAVLFASTPLFTLPLSLFIGQRVGWLGVLGAIAGFAGVAGILLGGEREPVRDLGDLVPVVARVPSPSPTTARFPTFVTGRPGAAEAGSLTRPPALLLHADLEEPGAERPVPRLMLLGDGDMGAPYERAVGLAAEGAETASPRPYVSWADTPRGVRLASGALLLARPRRLGTEPYGHGVELLLEDDGPPGRSLGWLHEDVTSVEHGFVDLVARPDGSAVAVWLDDREDVDPTPAAGGGQRRTSLWTRSIAADGGLTDEVLLDPRVSQAGPVDCVMLDGGALLVAYRDRSGTDERDIAVVRCERDGTWGAPVPVHADGWVIQGAPVDGPAIASRDGEVCIAWPTQVTSESGEPVLAIRLAWSSDGGASFGAVQTIATGRTLGRVDVEPVGDGVYALVHLATPAAAEGDRRAAWECFFVARGAVPAGPARIEDVEGGRRSGLLGLAPAGGEAAWAAWTGGDGIRLARIERGRAPQDPPADGAAESGESTR